jgi:hypothetical protein
VYHKTTWESEIITQTLAKFVVFILSNSGKEEEKGVFFKLIGFDD